MLQLDNLTGDLLKHLAGEMLSDDYKASAPVKSVAGSVLKCFGDRGTPGQNIKDIAQYIFASYNNAPDYQYNVREAALAKGVLEFDYYIKH